MKTRILRPLLFVLLCNPAMAASTDVACLDALATNSEFTPLKEKVALGRAETQTFSMKTNSSRATVFERPLIVKWVDARKECSKLNPGFDKMPPSLRNLYDQLWVQIEAAALNLYEGKITFGEFAQQRETLSVEYKKKLTTRSPN